MGVGVECEGDRRGLAEAQDPLAEHTAGGGAPLGVILRAGEEGASSVKPDSRPQTLSRMVVLTPERPSPAQRRLRDPGCLGRLHLFRSPASQFARFQHGVHDRTSAAARALSGGAASDVMSAPQGGAGLRARGASRVGSVE